MEKEPCRIQILIDEFVTCSSTDKNAFALNRLVAQHVTFKLKTFQKLTLDDNKNTFSFAFLCLTNACLIIRSTVNHKIRFTFLFLVEVPGTFVSFSSSFEQDNESHKKVKKI